MRVMFLCLQAFAVSIVTSIYYFLNSAYEASTKHSWTKSLTHLFHMNEPKWLVLHYWQ